MNIRYVLICLFSGILVLVPAFSPIRAGTPEQDQKQEKQESKKESKKEGIVVTDALLRQGKALFTGENKFAKGGAPCIACHALRYPGIRGGNWGPDLTEMYTNLGEEDMIDNLKTPSFAGMKKMYKEKPLADDEITALTAFAKDVASGRKENAPHYFPWAGIAFFGVIMVILTLYKRRIR